jgi:Mn-dependent DtxR family transcriptional regulator
MQEPSSEVQDYLKTIYLLHQRQGEPARPGSRALGSPASVTGMVKKSPTAVGPAQPVPGGS